jgi:sugar phosphate isomerase/epimerase
MPVNRREFLQLSSTAMIATSIESLASSNQPLFSKNDNFKLKLFATNWGWPGSLDGFFAKAKADGYDGAELWCPPDEKGRKELLETAARHNMLLGLLLGSGNPDPQKNKEEFFQIIPAALAMKPVYINCHTGKDFFSFEQLKPFFEFTIEQSQQKKIPIYHETHRGRALYSAPVTKNFMDKLPGLRITFDVSHWCVVHESLLGDQQDTLKEVLNRVDHIHARIGHAEGPQVNDPRAPEWENAVKAHIAWWDTIVERKKKNGETMTILTEFGPPDYMPTLPYTQQPLSDQWAINVFMKDLLRKRYG